MFRILADKRKARSVKSESNGRRVNHQKHRTLKWFTYKQRNSQWLAAIHETILLITSCFLRLIKIKKAVPFQKEINTSQSTMSTMSVLPWVEPGGAVTSQYSATFVKSHNEYRRVKRSSYWSCLREYEIRLHVTIKRKVVDRWCWLSSNSTTVDPWAPDGKRVNKSFVRTRSCFRLLTRSFQQDYVKELKSWIIIHPGLERLRHSVTCLGLSRKQEPHYGLHHSTTSSATRNQPLHIYNSYSTEFKSSPVFTATNSGPGYS